MARGASTQGKPRMTVSRELARFAEKVDGPRLPPRVRDTIRLLMLDVAGLCVAARNSDYVAAARASAASTGKATAFGHEGGFGPYDAALINGTAAHGEDFDDTFEGGAVDAGAVIVPAVLAGAPAPRLSGPAICKASLVAARLIGGCSLLEHC